MTATRRRRGRSFRFHGAALALATLLLIAALAACSGPDSNDETAEPDPPLTGTTASGDPTAQPEQTSTVPTAPAGETAAPTATSGDGEPTQTTAPGDPTRSATTPPAPNTPTPEPTRPAPPADPNTIALSLQQVGDGFDQPVLVTHAGDGSGRTFVLEKTGYVRLLDRSPYLDIADQVLFYGVRTTEHELGLLGLAFHPEFETNRFFYVHYTDRRQQHVISRFTEGADGRADPNSERVLFTYPQPDVNFVGGHLEFGPDGYLYIAMGTGTSDDASQIIAQELDNLYGKILRIDVDGAEPYGIPADNPFVDEPGARGEIWAYGLRNPWRFDFDPATGDLYIGGPGEFQREWINFQAAGTEAGRNFGWPILEGGQCWEAWTGACTTEGFELPIYSRQTYQDGNCVIIGGAVYRGRQSPVMDGVYFFSDYCSGRIWGLARDESGAWRDALLHDIDGLVSSFGRDEAGELYILDIDNGRIYRLIGTPR